jgi:hypothetical protein
MIYFSGMIAVQKDHFSKHVLAFRVLGIGWYIAFSLCAGALGGFWLDKHYDTAPIFSLLGVTLGLVLALSGGYAMIRPLIKEINREDTKDADKEDN